MRVKRVNTTHWIRSLRGPKNPLDPRVPYGFFVEPERTRSGEIADVLTVLLTNRECTYTCLMCDLWQNTLDETVPSGAIVAQLEHALEKSPPARVLKLYNAGSFLDPRSIPREEWAGLARLAEGFEAVIVECHPSLVNPKVLELNRLLGGKLQVAIGLETIHPEVLPKLNKNMSTESFAGAVSFLTKNEIPVRSFILVRPPYLSDEEGIRWALESLRFAQESGVECSVLIATRGGNGVMEELAREGSFSPPSLEAVESAFRQGLAAGRGRVLVDLWELERTTRPGCCGPQRMERCRQMNLEQTILPAVACAVTEGTLHGD